VFVHCRPSLQEFKAHLSKYQRPRGALRIKALLLDQVGSMCAAACVQCAIHSHRNNPPMQAFTAGVGNWVADEVLYQVR
jgi:formamidopyrimidine-DNA glycosylase